MQGLPRALRPQVEAFVTGGGWEVCASSFPKIMIQSETSSVYLGALSQFQLAIQINTHRIPTTQTEGPSAESVGDTWQ